MPGQILEQRHWNPFAGVERKRRSLKQSASIAVLFRGPFVRRDFESYTPAVPLKNDPRLRRHPSFVTSRLGDQL